MKLDYGCDFTDHDTRLTMPERHDEEPTAEERARIDAYAEELTRADLIRRRKAVASLPPAEVGPTDPHPSCRWQIFVDGVRRGTCNFGTSQADADLMAREALAELLHYGTVPAGTIAKIERW